VKADKFVDLDGLVSGRSVRIADLDAAVRK
jgi:hypothetical protein